MVASATQPPNCACQQSLEGLEVPRNKYLEVIGNVVLTTSWSTTKEGVFIAAGAGFFV